MLGYSFKINAKKQYQSKFGIFLHLKGLGFGGRLSNFRSP